MAVPLVAREEYESVVAAAEPLFAEISKICQATGEAVEGNCFYFHKQLGSAVAAAELLPKQMNIFSLGRAATDILEIGFNAGHSTLLFLLANPATHVTCFDICEHAYTRPCFEFIERTFPGRCELIAGDSTKTVPAFVRDNPGRRFDLVHIDGCHEAAVAELDFWNCYGLAARHILWDDTQMTVLNDLLNKYIRMGLVKEIPVHPTMLYQHRLVSAT